jgi:hypothetical protein
MTTKLLVQKGVKPDNYDNEGYCQFHVKPSYKREQVFSAQVNTVAPLAGYSNECTIDFANDFSNQARHGLLESLILEEDLSNASGDGTVTHYNYYIHTYIHT